MTRSSAHSSPRRSLAIAIGLLLLGLLLSMAAACGGEDRSGPPEIHYGRDACAECHMIISEPRFAAAYRDRNGDPFVFDDIGDMVARATKAGVIDSITAWVHDYNTEKWIDAKTAWFVRSDIQTPMGHGIVAFAHEDDAKRFAEERNGQVIRWATLIQQDDTADPGHTTESPPDHQMVPTPER